MRDSFGRTIDYLRISVTDRCNLRCVYCMPKDGVEQLKHEDLLTLDEISRVSRVMAGLGLRKVKLTGGEPLVRKNLPELVRQLKAIPQLESITLTTNGVELARQMPELARAGISAVNISLDTLNRQLYQDITRRDRLDDVLKGLDAALAWPGITVKINCVPLNRPEQDLAAVAGLAKDRPVHVRFIEMMPIGLGRQFGFLGEEDILRQLAAAYGPLTPCGDKLGNGPCHYYSVSGFQGRIGFISAMSHQFCDQCNRIRLTSQGFLKTCLQYEAGRDLRALLRADCTDEELKQAILEAVARKPAAHHFLDRESGQSESHNMNEIGG